MQKKTLLAVMRIETPDADVAALAEAARAQEVHLTCLILGIAPPLPAYAYGMVPYADISVPDNWSDLTETARMALSARANEVEAVLGRSGVSGDVQAVSAARADLSGVVGRRARFCDLVYLVDDLRGAPEIFYEAGIGVLYGAPVGLRLNGAPLDTPGCVFVAWDNSEAAARAVHMAMPQLCAAERVIVACFDPDSTSDADGADPGVDLARWLSHAGCDVTVSQFPSGGHEIGKCITDRAREVGADLIVMGAYGHARIFQAVFGGTTRTLMEQKKIPVLLAH